MKTKTMWVLAATVLLGNALQAQNITGTWQGNVSVGGTSFRQIFRIGKAESGYRAVYYSLDEASDSVDATSVVLDGQRFKLAVGPYFGSHGGASYEGTLAPDGRSLTGTWIEPDGRFPLTMRRVRAKEEWAVAPHSHSIRFIQVDTGVKLEVLDWGGTGRPLVFLSGLGDAAHVFDSFAPKFTTKYHVYGITRRGFGASSSPAFTHANYLADRLGDDVLAIIDSLGLHRPILAGHSIAGEELSSIGSRHPDKVAGLIYLDAGYGYAFYNRTSGDFILDRRELIRQLQQLRLDRLPPSDVRTLVHALRDSTLPRFEKDLARLSMALDAMPANAPAPDTTPSAARAILDGEEEYTSIPVPVLAIFAVPHKPTPDADAKVQAQQDSFTATFATAFENGIPTAHVVRIPNSTHYVFESNEADVLREMNAFLAGLPPE